MTGTVPIVKIVTKFKTQVTLKIHDEEDPLACCSYGFSKSQSPIILLHNAYNKELGQQDNTCFNTPRFRLIGKNHNDILSVHGFHCALLNNISFVDLSHFSQVSHSFLRMITSNINLPAPFVLSTKIIFTKLTSNTHAQKLYVCSSFPFVMLCGHRGRQRYLRPSCVDLCLLKSPLSDN